MLYFCLYNFNSSNFDSHISFLDILLLLFELKPFDFALVDLVLRRRFGRLLADAVLLSSSSSTSLHLLFPGADKGNGRFLVVVVAGAVAAGSAVPTVERVLREAAAAAAVATVGIRKGS